MLIDPKARRDLMRELARQPRLPGTEAITPGRTQSERALEAAELAFARVLEPHAPKTREAYARVWRRWAAWCEPHGAVLLPIDPADIVRHLEQLSLEGAAPNSVRLALSALASLDRASRVTPLDHSPRSLCASVIVRRWLKGWGREHPRAPQRQARALFPNELRRVLELVTQGPAKGQARGAYVRRAARDKAMLLVGTYGALRVSELVALELEQVALTERGLELTIARSKTDQDGKGRKLGILPAGELAVCPVEAFTQWMRVRGDKPGPLFVEIGRDGELGEKPLTGRSANRIIKGLAERAGVKLITSHSMRATFVTLAVRRRVPLPQIAQHTGHKSMQTLSTYARQASLFSDNPTAGLLDE